MRSEDLLQHRDWLQRTARALTYGRRSAVIEDDIVQEGWLAMWKAYINYDSERGPLDLWLKANARWRMKTIVSGHYNKENADEEVPELPYVIGDIETAYHDGEIMDAINRLTPKQRDYVFRRFWLGQYESEMKAHFGYTPTGLWHGKSGARMKLQQQLAHLA